MLRRRSSDPEITRQGVSDIIVKLMIMDNKLNLIVESLIGGDGEED